jgi:hypothetical protein
MATVLLVGTLDTKREEYGWLRDRLAEAGCDALMVDVGTFAGGAGLAEVSAAEVAQAAGADLQRLQDARDRGTSSTRPPASSDSSAPPRWSAFPPSEQSPLKPPTSRTSSSENAQFRRMTRPGSG